MPPLAQASIDLEDGSSRSSIVPPCPFPVFLPQPKSEKSQSSIDDSVASKLQALALSGPNSPTQTTGNDKTQKKRASVNFSSSVRVRLIPSKNEISHEQKLSVWYSKDETKAISADALQTLERMANNKPLGPNETTRGLENKTPKEHRIRFRRVRRTILTVLREQNKYSSSSRASETWDDDEYIARVSRRASRDALTEAICIAAIDAREITGR